MSVRACWYRVCVSYHVRAFSHFFPVTRKASAAQRHLVFFTVYTISLQLTTLHFLHTFSIFGMDVDVFGCRSRVYIMTGVLQTTLNLPNETFDLASLQSVLCRSDIDYRPGFRRPPRLRFTRERMSQELVGPSVC